MNTIDQGRCVFYCFATLCCELACECIIELGSIEIIVSAHTFEKVLYHLLSQICMIALIEIEAADGFYEGYRCILDRRHNWYYPLHPFQAKENVEQEGA